MLVVISPAKSLDFETAPPVASHSQAELLADAQVLIDRCRQLSPEEIAGLMKISPKLSALNFERFSSWTLPFTQANAKQALYCFTGDVYQGLDAPTLSAEAVQRAQNQLRILSGLYGLLRPLDLMQAYRLEMGTKLSNERGKNLYEFWGSKITDLLNKSLAEQQTNVLVNLASNEYFKAIKTKQLNATVVTPQFKEYKNGELKMISFYAKKARGMMLRFMLENKITKAEELKRFDVAGYSFDENLSKSDTWVFTR